VTSCVALVTFVFALLGQPFEIQVKLTSPRRNFAGSLFAKPRIYS